jgi:hypothetical protein
MTLAALPAPSAVPTQMALLAPSAPSWTTSDAASVSAGVPIHRVPFPHSPSPLPPWLAGTTPEPVFSLLPPRTGLPPLPGSVTAPRVGPWVPRFLYGGVDEVLFPSDVGTSTGAAAASSGPPLRAEGASQAVLCFYKLEFPMYDGLDDPLNRLNHYEQFFSGQQTPRRITRGWRPTTCVGQPRHGTSPSCRMRASLRGSASKSCATFSLGHRCEALLG